MMLIITIECDYCPKALSSSYGVDPELQMSNLLTLSRVDGWHTEVRGYNTTHMCADCASKRIEPSAEGA